MRTHSAWAILFMLGTLGASAEGTPPFRFSVIGIECSQCAKPIEKTLAALPGVRRASVDWKAGTAQVEIAPDFPKETIKAALSNLGFEAVFPGEVASGFAPLTEAELGSIDVKRLDGRDRIREKDLVTNARMTLIDYFGDWCGPCHVLELRLERFMLTHKGISLRRIDIGKWDNAAAREITRMGAASLPCVRAYGPDGRFLGSGGMWDEILALLEKAGISP